MVLRLRGLSAKSTSGTFSSPLQFLFLHLTVLFFHDTDSIRSVFGIYGTLRSVQLDSKSHTARIEFSDPDAETLVCNDGPRFLIDGERVLVDRLVSSLSSDSSLHAGSSRYEASHSLVSEHLEQPSSGTKRPENPSSVQVFIDYDRCEINQFTHKHEYEGLIQDIRSACRTQLHARSVFFVIYTKISLPHDAVALAEQPDTVLHFVPLGASIMTRLATDAAEWLLDKRRMDDTHTQKLALILSSHPDVAILLEWARSIHTTPRLMLGIWNGNPDYAFSIPDCVMRDLSDAEILNIRRRREVPNARSGSPTVCIPNDEMI